MTYLPYLSFAYKRIATRIVPTAFQRITGASLKETP
jgi:hypothetical protein